MKGMPSTSATVVLVTLTSVAAAGIASVHAGSIRNLIFPVPEGGKSFNQRLNIIIIMIALQKTGMLRPASDRLSMIFSAKPPLL